MNTLTTRHQILNAAAALLDGGTQHLPADELLCRVGEVFRVACTDGSDSDEAASLVDRADALLDRFQAETRGRSFEGVRLPDTGDLRSWLRAPSAHAAAILSSLDRLGAIAAGLTVLAEGSRPSDEALGAVREATRLIEEATERSAASLFDLGVAALERVVERGSVHGADGALLALDGAVHQRLQAALRGEDLAPGRQAAERVRPISAEQASQLGSLLARALQRKQPLEVAPELLDLSAFPGWGSPASRDLVLHSADMTPTSREVRLMKDVRVTLAESEIEVEVKGDEASPVMLVPLIHGEPGDPCPCRSGNHPRHFVFSPADPETGLEGYALVVGDRLAFLKV